MVESSDVLIPSSKQEDEAKSERKIQKEARKPLDVSAVDAARRSLLESLCSSWTPSTIDALRLF